MHYQIKLIKWKSIYSTIYTLQLILFPLEYGKSVQLCTANTITRKLDIISLSWELMTLCLYQVNKVNYFLLDLMLPYKYLKYYERE